MKSSQAPSTKGHLEGPRKLNDVPKGFRKRTSISKCGKDGALWGILMSEVSRLCPSPRNLCSGNMCPASHVHTLTANLLPDCGCMNACRAQRCLPQLLSILYPPFPWCGGHAHECEVVCIMREPEDDVGCFLSVSASSPRNRASPRMEDSVFC